jgi:hypothetical protein
MVIGVVHLSARHRFSDLSVDLQALLYDAVGGSGGERLLTKLEKHCFVIREMPIEAFPDISIWTDYRDRTYAEAMVGQRLPPAIVCGEKWLDGRHRVWVWRKTGMKRVPCIDLADIGLAYPFEGIARLNAAT